MLMRERERERAHVERPSAALTTTIFGPPFFNTPHDTCFCTTILFFAASFTARARDRGGGRARRCEGQARFSDRRPRFCLPFPPRSASARPSFSNQMGHPSRTHNFEKTPRCERERASERESAFLHHQPRADEESATLARPPPQPLGA